MQLANIYYCCTVHDQDIGTHSSKERLRYYCTAGHEDQLHISFSGRVQLEPLELL